MRILLDTHVLIWWLTAPEILGDAVRSTITRGETIVHVSVATIWEIALKMALGRLDLGGLDIAAALSENGFIELPIVRQHALRSAMLPQIHRDPFDRMIIAQAQVEGLVLVSTDAMVRQYDVRLLS